MKIKLLVGLSGPDFSKAPGDEYECSAAEAQRHIDAGHAVAIPKAARPAPAAPAGRVRGAIETATSAARGLAEKALGRGGKKEG